MKEQNPICCDEEMQYVGSVVDDARVEIARVDDMTWSVMMMSADGITSVVTFKSETKITATLVSDGVYGEPVPYTQPATN